MLSPPFNQRPLCMASGGPGDRTSLSSFTVLELLVGTLSRLDDSANELQAPFHLKKLPTK